MTGRDSHLNAQDAIASTCLIWPSSHGTPSLHHWHLVWQAIFCGPFNRAPFDAYVGYSP